MEGIVFNIKRYSIHDGPGIRTTVFLKGCPLDCIWCHNPEGIEPRIGFFFDEKKCIDCGKCVEVCPVRCIEKKSHSLEIDIDKCLHCGQCTALCPAEAIRINGIKHDSSSLLKELLKDEIFYDESGGGVTFSGGEPFYQFEFLKDMLKKCKNSYINTVVDTSGFVSEKSLSETVDLIDTFLFDFKLFDSDKHKKYTGVPNELIKNNFKFLLKNDKDIWVRIPLIPSVNDDDENISNTVEFFKKIGFRGRVHILAYHDLSETKEMKLVNNSTGLRSVFPIENKKRVVEIYEYFLKNGFETHIGG